MHSRNFTDHVWIQEQYGGDPYSTLAHAHLSPSSTEPQTNQTAHKRAVAEQCDVNEMQVGIAGSDETMSYAVHDLDVNDITTLPSLTPAYDNDVCVSDGVAAMRAYSRLQSLHIPSDMRRTLSLSLLRYCELDTLAMAMLIQGLFALQDRRAL